MRRLPSLAAVLTALLATLLAVSGCAAAPKPAAPAVGSIAAMGDSITRGFDACNFLQECPAKSWSTGTDPVVASHYSRLLARNPAMAGHVENEAKVGASSFDLPGQAQAIAAHRPDYVTVLIGANDACQNDESAMTSYSDFRANIDTALASIYAARPDTRVVVASMPDIYRLWQVGHTNASAQLAWSYGFCRTMLDAPMSITTEDQARRLRVRDREIEYNSELAAACAAHVGCHYDGGAVFRYPFTVAQLSPYDYFHPNGAGQKVLSNLTWAASGL